ncbi:MAG: hypothetical protein ACRDHP_14725, partial [Ktedonobacterales bacterium]
MRQRGPDALVRDEAPEGTPPAAGGELAEQQPAHAGRGRAAWSAVLLLGLVLLGLGDTLVTQVIFSAYAVSGGGANKVAAPPLLVALSLVASGVVGLLLALMDAQNHRWPSKHTRESGRIQNRIAAWVVRRRATWSEGIDQLRATLASVWDVFAALRRGERTLTARGRTGACLLALAVCLSLAADLGAAIPQSRPIAQWAWIASVAVLVAAAGALGHGARRYSMSRAAPREETEHRSEPQHHLPQNQPALASGWRERLTHIWRRWGDWLLVAVLLAGALALRLPDLTGLPYVVHGDEAWNGLE